jgi:hypothetical protein
MKQDRSWKWWQVATTIVVLPLLIVFSLLVLPVYLAAIGALHLAVWSGWCSRGRDVLFVYSDSPIWHDYIEERFLPYLEQRAVVLNWSQRRVWRCDLAWLTFCLLGGSREFNPLALVFRPFRPTRAFRFWRGFQEWKHGKSDQLVAMEHEFFNSLGINRDDFSP